MANIPNTPSSAAAAQAAAINSGCHLSESRHQRDEGLMSNPQKFLVFRYGELAGRLKSSLEIAPPQNPQEASQLVDSLMNRAFNLAEQYATMLLNQQKEATENLRSTDSKTAASTPASSRSNLPPSASSHNKNPVTTASSPASSGSNLPQSASWFKKDIKVESRTMKTASPNFTCHVCSKEYKTKSNYYFHLKNCHLL